MHLFAPRGLQPNCRHPSQLPFNLLNRLAWCLWAFLFPLTLIRADEGKGAATPLLIISQTTPFAYDPIWDDGLADVATYSLTLPRYGEERQGRAVVITVKEPYSFSSFVKADKSGPDVGAAMKLLTRKSFPTGVYTYELGTSAFMSLQDGFGFKGGDVVAATYSSQEWCGLSYARLTRRNDGWKLVSHSYFQGESHEHGTLVPVSIPEEGLPLMARGIAPLPGRMGVQIPVMTSMERSHLDHFPARVYLAKVSVTEEKETVTVQGVTYPTRNVSFEEIVEDKGAKKSSARSVTFVVSRAPPHYLLGWSTSWGESSQLLGLSRIKYWELTRNDDRRALKSIGLDPSTKP